MVDPSDPLSPYNRRLAAAFVRRHYGTVLRERRLVPTAEGHTVKSQARFVDQMMRRHSDVVDVAEIGFNAGHSTYLFLASRPDVRVVSFDLGEHPYVDLAKSLIDRSFPGRHELVIGDSRQTVPAYAREHPDRRFDLVFIDGGHSYEVATADVTNGARLGDRPLVVIDDMVPAHEWGVGPVRAWTEAVERRLVDPLLLIEDGFPLTELDASAVRPDAVAWAVGRYRNDR